jgi:hypothetical protein
LEDSSDLLPGLTAELADDRGGIKAQPGDLFLVVSFEVCLFVSDGVDIVVMGLLGSFNRLPPIP